MSEIVCRACGKSQKNANQMKSIFSNLELHEAIFKLTSIKVEQSVDLPDSVCTKCTKKLFEFNDFRETFLRVQGELNAVYIKVEPYFDEEIANDTSFHEESMSIDAVVQQPENTEIEIKADNNDNDNESEFAAEPDIGQSSSSESIQSDEDLSKKPRTRKPKTKKKTDVEQNFACSIPGCERKFKTEARLDLHVAAHTIQFIAGCNICDKEFRTPEKLETHMKSTHLPRKAYICNEGDCQGRSFNRKEHYRKHLKNIHKMEDPTYKPVPSLFKCDEPGCKRKFKTEEKLTGHKRKHAGLKGWPCELCPKAFQEEKNLRRHIFELHETDTPRYTCPQPECNGKMFWHQQTLESHLRTVHCPKEKDPYRYFCDVCGKAVKTALSLKSHKAIHDGEYLFECHLCGRKFRIKGEMKLHLMRHAGVRKYECDKCDYKGVTPRHLRNHKNNMHVKKIIVQTPCTQCDQLFNKKSSMRRHFKIVHLQLKPYKCKYCDQTFGKKMTLDHHEMRHTGEKAHFCPYCGKGFIQKVALKTHLKTHDKVKELGGTI